MLTQTITSLLSSVIGLVGSVIILFTLSPTLLLVVLLLAPALIAVAIVFGRPLQRVSTQVQDAHRPQHDHRRGGPGRHPRGQELRARGLGAPALRRRPAGGRRRGIATRPVAGGLRGAHGLPRLRRRSRSCSGTPATRSSTASLGIGTLTGFLLYGVTIGASLGTIAGLYGQFREGTGAVDPRVRDHRHPPDRGRRAGCRRDRPDRGPHHARRRVVRLRAGPPVLRAVDLDDRGRGDPRARGAVGLGQDHARAASSHGCGT